MEQFLRQNSSSDSPLNQERWDHMGHKLSQIILPGDSSEPVRQALLYAMKFSDLFEKERHLSLVY